MAVCVGEISEENAYIQCFPAQQEESQKPVTTEPLSVSLGKINANVNVAWKWSDHLKASRIIECYEHNNKLSCKAFFFFLNWKITSYSCCYFITIRTGRIVCFLMIQDLKKKSCCNLSSILFLLAITFTFTQVKVSTRSNWESFQNFWILDYDCWSEVRELHSCLPEYQGKILMICWDDTFWDSVDLEGTSTGVLSPTYFVLTKSRIYGFKLSGKLEFNYVSIYQLGVSY